MCTLISGAQGGLKLGGRGALSPTHPGACMIQAFCGFLLEARGRGDGVTRSLPSGRWTEPRLGTQIGPSLAPSSVTYYLCDLNNLPGPQFPHL